MTATVTKSSGSATPTGTVSFYSGTPTGTHSLLGTGTLNSSAKATLQHLVASGRDRQPVRRLRRRQQLLGQHLAGHLRGRQPERHDDGTQLGPEPVGSRWSVTLTGNVSQVLRLGNTDWHGELLLRDAFWNPQPAWNRNTQHECPGDIHDLVASLSGPTACTPSTAGTATSLGARRLSSPRS